LTQEILQNQVVVEKIQMISNTQIPSKSKVSSTINRKQQEVMSGHTNNKSILSKGKLIDS
jgi:hypothetical protein